MYSFKETSEICAKIPRRPHLTALEWPMSVRSTIIMCHLINAKMIPVENIPRIMGEGNKGKR
jgi:hypothetical protein